MEKVKPIAFTDWIPNDTITFRKNFSPEMREKIVQALLDFAERDSGKEVLKNLFSINGFVLANDKDYDVVRTTLKTLGMEASQYIK
ncbi:MAG: hypothetical protein DRJ01_15700 [Bacteroidetes bacterium]|nr:MAG: hypothetical protein DRJ01_15700 [Bacteroidota bacterium]